MIYDSSATALKRTTVNSALDITSHPVGVDDAQTLTNKTVAAPTISSPTLSGTVTGTYTLAGTPTFPASVVTLTGSQTLTNKVLASPTITSPTITNPTVTVDSISEFTSANGVTVDNLNIKDGKLNTNNSVVTANITDGNVTPDKLTNPFSFSVYSSTTVLITTTTQKVTLNTKFFDPNNNFDNTTNYRYNVPVTGKYFISFGAAFGSAGMGLTESGRAALYKNGTILYQTQQENGSGDANKLPRPNMARIISLTAGDYLELYVIMGGVYRDIVGGPTVTFMDGYLVSKT